ncbi:MAG: DUF4416 family protein [Deltaproteobacteria bacterium]|nr:DUF4416 family protein [Deltaproteobacteria bacterium]
MSRIQSPPAVKFFLAAFGQDSKLLDAAVKRLTQGFSEASLGPVDVQSRDFPFDETKYYSKEMGEGLVKRYLSWTNLLTPDKLVPLKLLAMDLEHSFSESQARRVNLDPGYIFAGGLVLSTGKFSGHRLYLGEGLWGELTLHYHHGNFRSFAWTYLDYQKPEVLEVLRLIRDTYFHQLTQMPASPRQPLQG